uniref:Cell division protein n=1 Tax=Ostreococcus mediterraneus virus 2 TaxID=2726183 RepID=A0A6H1QU13_9PHYC|nr:cell division protein [Ostreococcus mediterraneus virus 2]
MFSVGKPVPIAPPIRVERKREYHPRTYTEFVRGLKNGEFPEVLIKPNQNLAVFDDDEGNYGDARIIQIKTYGKRLPRVMPMFALI